MNPLSTFPRHLVDSWATSSQLMARRNAMLAASALAQRRAERAEVDHYIHQHVGQLTSTRHVRRKIAGA